MDYDVIFIYNTVAPASAQAKRELELLYVPSSSTTAALKIATISTPSAQCYEYTIYNIHTVQYK
jgi:hypothetical protein